MSGWSIRLAVLLVALGGGVLWMTWLLEQGRDDLEPLTASEVLEPGPVEAAPASPDPDGMAAPPIPPRERLDALDSLAPESERKRSDEDTALQAATQRRAGILQPRRTITPDEVFEARHTGLTDEEIRSVRDLLEGRLKRAKAKAFDELYEAGRHEVIREQRSGGGLEVAQRADEPLVQVRLELAPDGTPEGHQIRIPFSQYPEIYETLDAWEWLRRKTASSERE